jgi:antibiotic biosynthesis monooxygenase (ABM) superfamily enzyme
MDPFRNLLIKINDRLDLPQPTKSRIILEIAADLNDAYLTLKNQGVSDEEAVKRAKHQFDLNNHALNDLVHLHQTYYRRWFDHLSSQAQSLWERMMLITLLTFIIVTGSYTAFHTPIISEVSSFVWIIITITLFACFLFLLKIYQLFIKKDHRLNNAKKGISILLFIPGINLIIGLLGYYWELYQFKEYGHILETKMIYLIVHTDPLFHEVYEDLIQWTIHSSAFAMIVMVTTIITALMWYFLMAKISKIEEAEAEILLTGREPEI